jgi:fluoride exporter
LSNKLTRDLLGYTIWVLYKAGSAALLAAELMTPISIHTGRSLFFCFSCVLLNCREGEWRVNVIALAIGGFLGTILRYGFGLWIQPLSNGFPLGTLIINLIGSFFLGWFFTIVLFHWRVSSEIRLGIGTGFTGAFTTFSTFSLEAVHLFQAYHSALAILYIFVSIMGGIALSGAGYLVVVLQSKTGKQDAL